MSIVRKIILGYVILILIPVVVFGFYYYAQVYGNLTNQFAAGRQKILEQAYANMKADLARIDSVQRMLQYNPYVTDYLGGIYETDAESIYAYNRYISPIITQSLFVNPEIESFIIYKSKNRVLSITDRIQDSAALNPQVLEVAHVLKPGQGKWILSNPDSPEPRLVFYQNVYNTNFTEIIGLLELRINGDLIRKFYRAAGGEGDWKAVLLPLQGQIEASKAIEAGVDQATLKRLGSGNANAYFINRKYIVNQLDIGEFGVRVAVIGKISDVFRIIRNEEIFLVATIVILLAALSFVYYLLSSAIAKRILLLARHMRNLNDGNMRQYPIKRGSSKRQDEIGFLTATYNSMIGRMDELINNIHRAELRNKEAAYKVLQAQIKPHFLYNTLETIRMLAESNNDKEVADISYWFGKLMRYSLSSKDDHTVLAKEIETAVFYLKIHKMRLQNRLTFETDIAIDTGKISCPRFILQPLVENCIIHGASATLRPVHITLDVAETDHAIRISISDSGAGIPGEKLLLIRSRLSSGNDLKPVDGAEETGIGLYNVSERIKSFYGDASQLLIDSEPGKGTCLTIIIPKGAAA